LEVNQGEREAEVLAVIGDQALIEYLMPNGTSSLRIVDRMEPDARVYKNATYQRLPKKWVQAMDDAGSSWIGQPQSHGGKK
jgi:hypothetical protein